MNEASHVDVYGNSFPGKGNCKCKGPKCKGGTGPGVLESELEVGVLKQDERGERTRAVGPSQRCLGARASIFCSYNSLHIPLELTWGCEPTSGTYDYTAQSPHGRHTQNDVRMPNFNSCVMLHSMHMPRLHKFLFCPSVNSFVFPSCLFLASLYFSLFLKYKFLEQRLQIQGL